MELLARDLAECSSISGRIVALIAGMRGDITINKQKMRRFTDARRHRDCHSSARAIYRTMRFLVREMTIARFDARSESECASTPERRHFFPRLWICRNANGTLLVASRPAHGARDVETFFLFPFRRESKVQKTVKSIVRAFGCVIGRRRANSFSSHFLQVFFFSMEPTHLKIEGGGASPWILFIV